MWVQVTEKSLTLSLKRTRLHLTTEMEMLGVKTGTVSAITAGVKTLQLLS